MKIRIRKSDVLFSQFIRTRDGYCLRCGSEVEFNENGLPISHQASHFYGRACEATRFEPSNVDCMCFKCHQYFGANPNDYTEWKRKRMGEKRFNALMLRAKTMRKKRDDKLDAIVAKKLLDSVGKQQEGVG